MMKIKDILLLTLITILIILTIILFYNLIILQDMHEKLSLDYDNYKEECLANIGQLSETNQGLQKEIEQTISEIEKYQKEIQESIKWFKDNSILEEESGKYGIISYLKNNCFKKEGDICKIKTGCLYLTNSEKIGVEYKQDIDVFGKEDKLQSLDDFLENGGGDCEDYSLFYKAEWNLILDYCKDIEQENIKVESWDVDKFAQSKYFLDFDEEWYFEGVSKVNLKKGYIYPNVVCGNIYNLNTKTINGHCVIAFTKKKIITKKDLIELNLAPLVEPQDGSYMGLINDNYSGIYLLEEADNCRRFIPDSYIFSIITDNDYFLFSFDNCEWISYSIFDEELSNQKQNLLETLGH